MLSLADKKTLVKSVLTSQLIYHLTIFSMQKWLIKQIDKLQRSLLWKGEEPEKVRCGHSALLTGRQFPRPKTLVAWAS
jgi:hypothetical protein